MPIGLTPPAGAILSSALPTPGDEPLRVLVTRGTAIESVHAVVAAVVDAKGRPIACWGAADMAVFPRSAAKPLQALPLVASGAADALALGDAEIALATASHNAERRHVAVVDGWLEKLGRAPSALECGGHLPLDPRAAEALHKDGCGHDPRHNNCSGKHAGFLTLAQHTGVSTKGYVNPDHPVQRAIARAVGEMAGVALNAAPWGPDGCSIPTFAMPLLSLAHALARMAAPDDSDVPADLAAAAVRVADAMAAEPFLIAGSGRACTDLLRQGRGCLIAKTGAEGVYAAGLRDRGWGVAVKALDGAKRAAETAAATLLLALDALDNPDGLYDVIAPPVLTVNGAEVGRVRLDRGDGAFRFPRPS